jgi:hypothetical protein
MKKRLFLSAILVLGMVLVGCDDSPEVGDIWSNVTSLNQLNGTWKGSYSQTQTIMQMYEELTGEPFPSEMQIYGNIRVTTRVDITSTINASAKTQAMSMVMTMTFSGGNISFLWPFIKELLSDQDGVTINDSNHSMSMTQSQPATVMDDEDIANFIDALQINQNGTKIKLPAGIIGNGSPEIIMTKQ